MTEQIKEVKKHVYHNRWDNLVVCALSFRTIDPVSCTFFVILMKRNSNFYKIIIQKKQIQKNAADQSIQTYTSAISNKRRNGAKAT